jgi:hypothetical protein
MKIKKIIPTTDVFSFENNSPASDTNTFFNTMETKQSISAYTGYTGNNISDIIDGVDSLLTKLQNAIDSQVWGNQLPLLGDTLKNSNAVDFITDFKDRVLKKYFES